MGWQERLREAVYVSPSGKRFKFIYEDVKKENEKKTTGFNFPDANGTYVQDNGNTGRRIPLKAIFSGDDYDLDATEFENGLLENGIGKVEHPVYGVIDCVPFGSILREDFLVSAANQASVTVTLWESTGLIYPTAQNAPAAEVLAAVTDSNASAAKEYSEKVKPETVSEQISLKAKFEFLLGKAKAGLQSIANTQADVQRQFDAINSSINQSIDTLISDPLTIAFQTTLLLEAPARARTSIAARLNAYKDLANAIISGDGAVVSPSVDSKSNDEFHTNRLYASTYTAGSVLSVINNQFETKKDALEAADSVLSQLQDLTDWSDNNFQSLDQIDTGETYQQLQQAVALTAGFLVYISFSLKQERRFILAKNRSIIDLVGELYGSVDDKLDFFISSNDLSGSDIIELQKGREIVYYV